MANAHPLNTPITHISRRAWLVWGVAVGAYLIGVMQRSSLGVAGLEAATRLDVSAAALSTLAVAQVAMYAAMQIPVGIMVDRIGPRILLAVGAALMAAGQITLALADTLPVAVVARLLVGAGDAMTWLSVIRLVAAWMPPRRVPIFTQVTALTGLFGQILSAIPLVALLHGPGWTATFLSAASLSALMVALTLIAVRDTPDGSARRTRSHLPPSRSLRQTWQNPGTRMGFWAHVITAFPATTFLLLWGYPFLVSAQGRDRAEASTLFTLMAFISMAVSPFIGIFVARHPLRRSWLILGVTGSTIAIWTLVLVNSGPSPTWVVVALCTVLAITGPTSVAAFDYARTFNPPDRFGTASGMVNVGGFSASLVSILGIGVLLNLTGAGLSYSLAGFRVAMCLQYVIWAIGIIAFLRARVRARALMAEQGTVVPPLRDAMRRRWG